MSDTVTWGVLGAGKIAEAFVAGVKKLDNSRVVAIGSRSLEKAKAFAKEHGPKDAHCHGSYEDLLADKKVDAIYIATPHPMHAEWAIKSAQAGKHVFCEKPIGLNHAETMAMIEAARSHGVFLMEAFKDRSHPQTLRLIELLHEQAIGQVRMIDVTFGFGGGDEINPDSRLFAAELAGGGIMDVGCYAVEFARLIAGAAVGKPFLDPIEVKAVGQLGETGVDEWSAATFKFDSGAVAQIATAVRANLHNNCHIVGAHGTITLPDPWLNDRENPQPGTIILKQGKKETIIQIPAEHTSYGYETRVAAQAILAGKLQPDAPAMTWADSLGQMKTLDAWRKQIGLTYPRETPEHFTAPINGKPLQPVDNHNMKFNRVPGLDRDVSRFVMGCDNQTSFPHAAVMFDDFFQRGGNTFDTAFIYGGGSHEKFLGQWQNSRGNREQVNIICKGAHTPNCTPQGLTRELLISLDRLQTDHAEIYIMHRDNPEVPVGEFIDVLNEHADAGRIKVFGGSNWTLQRFAEANNYAKANNKQGMSLLSNNFSLARMDVPVWNGCVAATVPDSRQYLIEHQIANFAWSSQARGFFVTKESKGKVNPYDADGSWDTPDNRIRRERAFELAEKYKVTAINIAAAYVLCQPFPSFALIGPRTLHETATSMPAMDIQLTEKEMAYLDLRD